MKLVEVITEILKEVSPENAPYFEENKNSYEKELKELDDEFKDIVSNGRHRMIVVADKFPFRYFRLQYVNAFTIYCPELPTGSFLYKKIESEA